MERHFSYHDASQKKKVGLVEVAQFSKAAWPFGQQYNFNSLEFSLAPRRAVISLKLFTGLCM